MARHARLPVALAVVATFGLLIVCRNSDSALRRRIEFLEVENTALLIANRELEVGLSDLLFFSHVKLCMA